MAHSRMTSKGQVTIPVGIRKALGLSPGDDVVFEATAEYVAVRRVKTIDEVAGSLRDYGKEPVDPETEKDIIAKYLGELDDRTRTGGDRAG